jgi:hypothetical protein
MSRRDVKRRSRKTHNVYLYKISKKCYDLLIFSRPWGLTDPRSCATLLNSQELGGIYEVTVRYLESIYKVLFSIIIAIENH